MALLRMSTRTDATLTLSVTVPVIVTGAVPAAPLFAGNVTVACEVQILLDPGILRRVHRPDLGFNPLELGAPRRRPAN